MPPGARLLDVACGGGRHLRWFAARGARVTGVDRDASPFAALATDLGEAVELVQADLESAPWPWPGRRFDAVVVTNYLWRPLLPALIESLADGGVLLYETFAAGQQRFGRPSNPGFLLAPGELLAVAATAGLRVVAFEEGLADHPPRVVQRLVAVRQAASEVGPCRLAPDATPDADAGGSPAGIPTPGGPGPAA